MRASRILCISLAIGGLICSPCTARAQQPPAIDSAGAQAIRQEMAALRAEFEARMSALEARLAGNIGTMPPAPDIAAAQQAAAPAPGAGATGSNVFNPDMAVIGNVLGAAGKNTVNPSPGLELHETEITLQSVVDPYARADFFVSVGPSGAEIEEGFLTFPTLPGGLLMKVGKIRSSFGRTNTQHPHVLPWTDRPLVTANLVGGEEGINDAGISLARLVPNPWFFLEATGQVLSGDSGDVFQSSERSDVSVVGRLRGYQDITESTNIDLGASYARGHNDSGLVGGVDVGRFTTELIGVDAAIRWKPLQRSIYHSFIARAEGVLSRRDQPGGRQDAAGFFLSGDYQLARRWFAGVRYDNSERAADQSLKDTGQSLVLTFRPSEFSQVRGQYRRTALAEGVTANEFLFQFQFSIGAHGAHPFQ